MSNGIPCPGCLDTRSRVLETRMVVEGLRRRRLCTGCGQRWTTVELSAAAPVPVVAPVAACVASPAERGGPRKQRH
ncbi:hypothetical protein [Methyloversatilis sp.]|uniref:NrdR family transcriptional regulator n=1 Tax=Methyloversatilis sp. TaxID=2569862 RepID=UPI0035A1AD8C